MLGSIGQLLILVGFFATIVSGVAYALAAHRDAVGSMHGLGRVGWVVVTVSSVAAFALLAYLLYTNQYQYAYVYEHASNELPWYYVLSALWEGQEGSFLLWALFTSGMGVALLAWTPDEYEAPVMAVVAVCQMFLLSMIVGLPVGAIEIGATPFSGLAEAFPDAPVFRSNPGYVPADGKGLNELLKSYWMTIHPPMLFLGFAAMTAPFAFSVAALWKQDYTRWVRLALPWTLFALAVLGGAIALGGYWAYETLSFGGYWAWDPVENASLVPWIVGVAALHAMLIQKKSGRGHKAAFLLSILAYMMVVYESFLTRSGILAEVSVHSFVDLGLYNQLLIWMGTIALGGFGLFAWRYRELPTPERESRTLSREFFMFSGVVLLVATATVVIVGTSSPILGQVFRDQPSAVPIQFYDSWTLPLAIGIALLAGLGQLIWWDRMSVEHLDRSVRLPLLLSTASTGVVLLVSPFVQRTVRPEMARTLPPAGSGQAGLLGGLEHIWPVYGQSLLLLLLVFVSFFALYGNGQVLWRIARGNLRMAGGAIAHIGFAVMLLGIVASSGMSDPIDARGPDGKVRDYFVLTRGETRTVDGYRIGYVGRHRTARGRTAYELEVEGPDGRSFRLTPVAYKDGSQWYQHPSIETFFATDFYASVAPRSMQVDLENEDRVEVGEQRGGELTMMPGDSTVVGGDQYAVEFRGFDTNVEGADLPDSTRMAVAADLRLTDLQSGRSRDLGPIYAVMNDGSPQYIQNRLSDWGVAFTFAGMNVMTGDDGEQQGEAYFVVEGVEVTPEDWVVVQAAVKPFINVFWLGILLLTAGFGISLVRRVEDARVSMRRWVSRS